MDATERQRAQAQQAKVLPQLLAEYEALKAAGKHRQMSKVKARIDAIRTSRRSMT